METIIALLSQKEYVSGETISKTLGISRPCVWKKINQLKEQGWEITSGGKRGYHLEAGDSIHPALIRLPLQTIRMGQGEIRYQTEVGSTNLEAKRMAIDGAPDGSLCLCEKQTAGKGRLGRTWVSEPGVGLWQSLLLRPHIAPSQAPLITFCAAMAMAQAVREATGLDARIKWPNDLVVGGKKICGILLEMSADPDAIEYVVVGIGLNVYKGAVPPDLTEKAASIEDFTTPPLRRNILIAYLQAMEQQILRLEHSGFDGIMPDYRALSCTLGQDVQVIGQETFFGHAVDMDETGALLVRTKDGTIRRVLAGDVSVRGLMGYV